jgi:cytochrome c
MRQVNVGAAIAAALGSVVIAAPALAADAAHGKQVFAQCAACHSDKPDAIGPSLKGVYGRKSGSLSDFRYSNAMMRANLTWDDANLHAYIKDPQAKVPGNHMPFGGLSSDQDVDDVVAYLKDYK